MKNGYYGSIDVGTNAARMKIKNVSQTINGSIETFIVQEVRVPLRLGVDVFKYGEIKDKKEKQLIDSIQAFKMLMNIYDVIAFKAVATSALREAANGAEIIAKIKEQTDVELEILSGQEEASTISKIAKELNLDDTYVFVDVGGGSTEVTLYHKKKVVESNSFPIGTLRILAEADKPETWKRFKKLLKGYHDEFGDLDIVGTGGNINRYWKMSSHHVRKGNHVLLVSDFKKEYKDLKELTISERMEKYKLKPDRADVIIPAGKIYMTATEILNSKIILVPMIGLGDGLIDSLIQEDMNII